MGTGPIRFDLWQLFRPGVETRRNRKKLVIPAFSVQCGDTNGSVAASYPAGGALGQLNGGAFVASQYTIEEFVYIKQVAVNATLFAINKTNTLGGPSLKLNIDTTGLLTIVAYDPFTNVPFNTGVHLTPYQWTRITISRAFDTATTTVKLYIDGVLTYTGTTTNLTSDNIGNNSYFYPWGYVGNSIAYGNFCDWRIWDIVRTDDEVFQYWNKRLRGPISTHLVSYMRLNKQENGLYVDEVTHNNIVADANTPLDTANYPKIILGVSFIAAIFSVIADNKHAIKFPVVKPTDVNFLLCVCCADDNGVLSRNRLWDIDGADINPYPDLYNGETLPINFNFEVWNVDGNATCDLASDLTINSSIQTMPNTDTDHDQVEIPVSAIDSTLAEPSPIAKSGASFDTQQVYNV